MVVCESSFDTIPNVFFLPLEQSTISVTENDTDQPATIYQNRSALENFKEREKGNNQIIQTDIEVHDINLDHVVKSYKDNFSVHGLTKIFTGHPVERIIWFGLLFSCLAFVGRESYSFYKEYTNHGIRTEVRMEIKENMTLPVITICEKRADEIITKEACWNNRSIAVDEVLPCNQTKPLIDSLQGHDNLHVVSHPVYPSCIIINSKARVTLAA